MSTPLDHCQTHIHTLLSSSWVSREEKAKAAALPVRISRTQQGAPFLTGGRLEDPRMYIDGKRK